MGKPGKNEREREKPVELLGRGKFKDGSLGENALLKKSNGGRDGRFPL